MSVKSIPPHHPSQPAANWIPGPSGDKCTFTPGLGQPKTFEKIWRPPGKLLLCEQLNVVGEEMFGDQWSGLEMSARRAVGEVGNRTSNQIADMAIQKLWWHAGVKGYTTAQYTDLTRRRARRLYGFGVGDLKIGRQPPNKYRVCTSDIILGRQVVETLAEAESLWAEEKPKLIKMRDEEIAARQRFEAAFTKCRDELYSGNMLAKMLTQYGLEFVVPTSEFGKPDAMAAFDPMFHSHDGVKLVGAHSTENWMSFPLEHKGKVVVIEGLVFIDNRHAEAGKDRADNSTPPHELPPSSTTTAKTSAEKIFRQIVARTEAAELPPLSKADAFKEVLETQKTAESKVSKTQFEKVIWPQNTPESWRRPGPKKAQKPPH